MFSQTHGCPRKLIRTQMPSRCVFWKILYTVERPSLSWLQELCRITLLFTIICWFKTLQYIISGRGRDISCSTHGSNNQGIKIMSALNFIFLSSHCKVSGVHLEKQGSLCDCITSRWAAVWGIARLKDIHILKTLIQISREKVCMKGFSLFLPPSQHHR